MLHLHTLTPKSTAFPPERAVVMGSFDGVHRGHQVLLQRLIAAARARGLRATVLILEPQPREYFHRLLGKSAATAPPRLLPLSAKINRLAELGVDDVAVLHFRAQVVALTAEAFVAEVLRHRLNAQWVMTGEDFRFGQGRLGSSQTLQDMAAPHGFHYEALCNVNNAEGVRYASTRLRADLAAGDFAAARQALGCDYALIGRVARGLGLAHQWGIPTANLYFRQKLAVSGVFAGTVTLMSPHIAPHHGPAVLHLGAVDPNRGNNQLEKLEAHLLNFPPRNLLGCRLRVTFLHKIRDSVPFNDEASLKKRIMQDREEVADYFLQH